MLLQLIFPPKCIFCDSLLKIGSKRYICDNCYHEIPFNYTEINSRGYVDKIIAACSYTGIIRKALIKFKFNDRPGFYRTLAQLFVETTGLYDRRDEFDVIVGIPLHKKRKSDRGYNQAQLLAKEISKKTGIADWSAILERPVYTEAQSLLNRDKRQKNIKGAFRVLDPKMISGKKVLIIDDIVTTGSTLNECGIILKMCGATYVEAGVIAHADKLQLDL